MSGFVATLAIVLARASPSASNNEGSPVPSPAPHAPVVWTGKPVTLDCTLAAGPRLTACSAENPADYDAERLNDAITRTESTPPCYVPHGAPGQHVTRRAFVFDHPVPKVSIIQNPDWAERPRAEAVKSVYPRGARVARIAGRVMMVCLVGRDGRTRDCSVTQEDPVGDGVGAAAIRLAKTFRFKPQTRDCEPVDGARVTLPINFTPTF